MIQSPSYFGTWNPSAILPTARTLLSSWPLKSLRPSRSGGIPGDIVLAICDYLSVKDVLTLRCVNKHYSMITTNSNIWYHLLRRLPILYPVLPATSRHLFGSLEPSMYEALVKRSVYLTDNWESGKPIADRVLCETFHEPCHMIFLPGGRYLIMQTKNKDGRSKFALVLYDMKIGMALMKVPLEENTDHLTARYAMVNKEPAIVIALTVMDDNADGTRVQVLGIVLNEVEQLSDAAHDRFLYEACAADALCPFVILHDMVVEGKVADLDLADTDGNLLLAILIAPLSMIFAYIGHGNASSRILLARIGMLGYTDTVWKLKLIPSQLCVIVTRIVIPLQPDAPSDPQIFCLEMYKIPRIGVEEKHPFFVGRQALSGLNITSFHFSDLELTWHSAASNPLGLLNTPLNREPPPISIYALTKYPSGVVHFLLRPEKRPDLGMYRMHNGMEDLPRYLYMFPAERLGRYSWKDDTARPRLIPGAFRFIAYTLPRYKPSVAIHLNGIGVQRFLAGRLIDEEDPPCFAGSRTTGHAARRDEEARPADENVNTLKPLMVPFLTDECVPEEMTYPGTTAMAWDETTGKLVYAIAGQTQLRLLDFGQPLS